MLGGVIKIILEKTIDIVGELVMVLLVGQPRLHRVCQIISLLKKNIPYFLKQQKNKTITFHDNNGILV